MEPEKEKWINDVLRSLDGLQRAEPNPFLYAKIYNRLTGREVPDRVSLRTAWLTVASFSLLALLNWWIAVGKPDAVHSPTSPLSSMATEMQLYPTTDQLYDTWTE